MRWQTIVCVRYLAMLDEAILTPMHEFDRVLHRDDVIVPLQVCVIHHAARVVDLPEPVCPVTNQTLSLAWEIF